MPANTSPDNITYPVSTDQVSPLESVFATLAASVQTALTTLKARVTAIEADTGWVDITISPGFAANSVDERPQVRRKNGIVYSKGLFASTGMSANGGHTVGTIPAGFLPPVNVIVRAGTSAGNVSATVFFSAAGPVIIRPGASLSSYYGVGGFSWTTN